MSAKTAIDLLARLVSFDSVSRNSNLPLIHFIRDYLEPLGISCTVIPSPDGTFANILARIGPPAPGGVILSGHTDVVPVDGQSWDTDPFQLTERDKKLYGRGTADMKSFLAVLLALAPDMAKLPLRKPIWLAFSYDEEVGCLGVPHLLDYMKEHAPSPAFVLIGEPTEMQAVTAHKGMLSFITTVRGLEWHSSQPQKGVNAVHAACSLVHYLSGLATELAECGQRDERFDPPCTTVHVGVIEGGTARNIIPRECRFQWEIRPIPGEDYATLYGRFDTICRDLEKQMRQISPEASIATERKTYVSAVTLPPEASPFAQTVMRALSTNRQAAVPFFTEGGVFQTYGIPAIICGPGSIRQAHQPNEFIETSQIAACIEFIRRLTADPSLTN